MKITKTGSTLKQSAYAKRIWSAQGNTKKEIALDVGYSKNMANSVKNKIEDKRGFHNAIAKLAIESNSIAISIMAEFKARGFKDFSNKDLVGGLNAITNAWIKFNAPPPDPNGANTKLGQNKLRTVILQQVENQVVNNPSTEPIRDAEVSEGAIPDDDDIPPIDDAMDF